METRLEQREEQQQTLRDDGDTGDDEKGVGIHWSVKKSQAENFKLNFARGKFSSASVTRDSGLRIAE
jgi:hypothetical protein